MVWVQFSGLILEYWDEKTLFTISRAIGNPIKVDAATLNYQSGFYAKVLIEVDLAKQIPNKLWIITRYGAFSQGVILTNLPKFCSKCKIIGHLSTEYRFNKQIPVGVNVNNTPTHPKKLNGNVSPNSLNILTPNISSSTLQNSEIPQPSFPPKTGTSGDPPPTIVAETLLVVPPTLEILVTSQQVDTATNPTYGILVSPNKYKILQDNNDEDSSSGDGEIKEVSASSLLEFGTIPQHVTIVPNIE
ncbi:uncharacterized protein LOC113279366 [Papaver somniferum]|uniref:uncharacterized protein LOC113279366 n=1 Tax=Papaver somniferum TaxID=3469 RepID=UPI000E701616|nr:uncharacterized protein LOC113279366 [Papaver somniferum]